MYKQDLALKNIQSLICHKTKPNQTKPYNQQYLAPLQITSNT